MSTQKPDVDVYSSFVHNCQNLEATRWPSVGELRESGIHVDHGILLNAEKK
jgi:hypothetical protein